MDIDRREPLRVVLPARRRAERSLETAMTDTTTMPAVFIGHGSPMNALEHNRYTDAWRAFGASVATPRAVLVVSAHWYTNATAVTAMAATARHPRLLRLPRRAVRLRLSRARPPRGRRARRRDSQPTLGRTRRRQLGTRPRHLVGARPHVPRRRRPRRAAVDQRPPTPRLPPRHRRPARTAARPGRAHRRQRQRRAQPAPHRLEPPRRRVRLEPPLRRRRHLTRRATARATSSSSSTTTTSTSPSRHPTTSSRCSTSPRSRPRPATPSTCSSTDTPTARCR